MLEIGSPYSLPARNNSTRSDRSYWISTALRRRLVATTFTGERATVVCVKTTPSRQMTKTLLLSLKQTQVIRRLYGSSLVLSPGYKWRPFYFYLHFFIFYIFIFLLFCPVCKYARLLSTLMLIFVRIKKKIKWSRFVRSLLFYLFKLNDEKLL